MHTKQKPTELISKFTTGQNALETLRFITCGSANHGKSTLIKHILSEVEAIPNDSVVPPNHELQKTEITSDNTSFSLLVDHIARERKESLTIEVAYRFFSTVHRNFIVAEAPGHEKYTRKMAIGATNADVAVILVDAHCGILSQTKRHSMICSILGVKNVVLAINKMDLVNYSQEIFSQIEERYRQFATELNFETITSIPISALAGDNIVKRSKQTKWFHGPTLINLLETIDTRTCEEVKPLRFPVEYANQPSPTFKSFSGTIESGRIKIGQTVRIQPSGDTANIKSIHLSQKELSYAIPGQEVTVTLDRKANISPGDVISSTDSPCEISDQFEIELVWMDEKPGYIGRTYIMKLGTSTVKAQITDIKHRINFDTFEKLSASKLELNDLSVITLKTDKMIPYVPHKNCRRMGGSVLIDPINKHTVATGMIEFALRRASNVHKHKLDIDKHARRKQNGHTSKVLWFTGLSGSGKSTIANALEIALHEKGIRTYILDGDNVRHGLNKDLGFTDADRIENIRRISEVAKLMVDSGIVVITAFISPFKVERQMARDLFEQGEFIEVFIDTPLDIAESRDPKGLYKKARKGELPNFTGIDSPYEAPESPDITLHTENADIDTLVAELINYLEFSV